MVKLAIIFNADRLSGKLTKFFTGFPAYHCGWVDEATDTFYDMHAIRRKRYWSDYANKKKYVLIDFNEVIVEQLEHELKVCEQMYSPIDYILFGLRPLFHFFGQSTRNAGGLICSEMVHIDAAKAGVATPWRFNDAPPSPADWFKWSLVSGRDMQFVGMKLTDV